MDTFQEPSINSLILRDETTGQWLHFSEPVEVVSTDRTGEVEPLLDYISNKTKSLGLYAAGYMGYEASSAFDTSLATNKNHQIPLCWFGLYKEPNHIELPDASTHDKIELNWQPEIKPDIYREAIQKIKNYIAEGDTYQVNYTFRMSAAMPNNSWEYFLQMIQAQGKNNLGAFLNTDKWCICSASPELFFSLDGRKLISRPMKGTRKRGLWSEDDKKAAEWLRHSAKNRAENVMIVDMVRNDLSRIAEDASVTVDSLFDLEKYNTLWQLTSTVSCDTEAGISNIFRALFPPSSITGAPKTRTMEIIKQLEGSPRNIYTGSIGYITPEQDAQFNVAIRTVWMDKRQATAHYGVGGGIVWDSSGFEELEECKTKAKVLNEYSPDFSLLETMLWEPSDGYFLLDKHIRRLLSSAEYFGFEDFIDQSELKEVLEKKAGKFKNTPQKVRLMVPRPDSEKALDIQAQPINRPTHSYRLAPATKPIDCNNPFLYHKTTNRSIYNEAKKSASGVEDVILYNEAGEITETCIANIVMKFGEEFLTPPIKCGLLDGVYRQHLLELGHIKEAVLTKNALYSCEKLYLINSVRKWWEPVLLNDRLHNTYYDSLVKLASYLRLPNP